MVAIEFLRPTAGAAGVVNGDIERYRHSKTVLKRFRKLYQEKNSENANIITVTESIWCERLSEIAKKIPAAA